MKGGHLIRSRMTVPIPPKTRPGRIVHAARARKLRRRGDVVNLVRFSPTGKMVYEWWPRPKASNLERRLFDMLADIERRMAK